MMIELLHAIEKETIKCDVGRAKFVEEHKSHSVVIGVDDMPVHGSPTTCSNSKMNRKVYKYDAAPWDCEHKVAQNTSNIARTFMRMDIMHCPCDMRAS